MVKAAYSSGTPALGVGPGNVPAYIERTANIPDAVRRILASKTFDNGTICASEQSIVTERCVKNEVIAELKRQGGHFVSGEDADRLARVILRPGAATLGMAAAVVLCTAVLDMSRRLNTLVAVAVGVVVYAVLAVALGVIRREDMAYLPGGRKIEALLKKLRLWR